MKNKIKESIQFYTGNSSNCQNMKILIDPIDYLTQTKKIKDLRLVSNLYNDNFYNLLNIIGTNNIVNENKLYKQNEFIKDKETLYQYLQHIQNILIQGYTNYYDTNYQLPNKLYRAISNVELEYLNRTGNIDNLWSTTSNLTTAQGYIIETEEYKSAIEYFILELPINHKIPFIDVDKNEGKVFEPNEFILMSSFNIANIKIIKTGKNNSLGFYDFDNIPIYQAKILSKHNQTIENINHEAIINLVMEIANNINIYGRKIEEYLNTVNIKKLTNDAKFYEWAKKLQQLFKMQQQYINNCIANQQNQQQLNEDLDKIKILK